MKAGNGLRIAVLAAAAAMGMTAISSAAGLPAGPVPANRTVRHWHKNWRAPSGTMLAQRLVDQIMGTHPELRSLTLHGVPPGTLVHTMFAGSFPHRIGNADDPGDLFCQKTGSTILDPSLDHPGRFDVFIPLRDAAGGRIGAIVIAFKDRGGYRRMPIQYYRAALRLRADLARRIPNLRALFRRVPRS